MAKRFGWIIVPAFVAAGCASTMMSAGPRATAQLEPTKGNATTGTVTFAQRGDRVVMTARVSGLAPGSHGFHIHEKGDCSSGDGISAGGHFNPTNKPHGNPASADHHGGDMPMLTADASGNAALEATLDTMSVGGGVTDVVGKSVIVHKDPDDYKTQPTGNSGARVACGIIVKA
jgi:superoxide dismutase, Cu-Zn family